MAIELNMRTKILAGVVVLAAAGAGAWFFLLQDEPPPPPPAAAKPPAKPAADAPKAAPDAAKPAAKPAALKPVPTDPAQVVAEVMQTSGTKARLQQVALDAMDAMKAHQIKDPAAVKEFDAAVQRLFEPNTLVAEVGANLKTGYDANRMPRYLDLLRQPISLKMVATQAEEQGLSADAIKEQMDKLDKTPLPEARAKLIARLEELNRAAGLGSEISAMITRGFIEGTLEQVQSSSNAKVALGQLGGGDPRNARPAMLARLNDSRGERIRTSVKRLAVTYRNASDEELAEYLKLIDTEIGGWGAQALAGALNPALDKRGREQGRAYAKLGLGAQPAAAKAPAKEKPAAEAPAEKPAAVAAAKAPAAPKEPPAYQRPANIREVYTRYNDLVTATVMRDRVAVKELLDDGKRPNVRQSDGTTPLMIAAGNGDADLVQMLLGKGADPNLRAAGGATALSIAKERRRADVVQLLERHGAKN